MPTTLKIELDKLGYDWDNGTMALQPGRGWESPGRAKQVKKSDPLLQQNFSNGVNLDLPRFIASDKKALYVTYRNHQGSGLAKVLKNAGDYIHTPDEVIPYPD